jgi:hypothetical protein
MYIIPLIVIVLIALAILLSPIFALIIMVLFLLGLGAFKFLGPGTEPENAPRSPQSTPPANAPGAKMTAKPSAEDEKTGLWGETWPEQREGEERS